MDINEIWKKKLLWWVFGSLGATGIGIMALILLFSFVLLGILVSSSDSSMDRLSASAQHSLDIPALLLPIYLHAENDRVSWARLAAIHKVSTDFGQEKAKRNDTISLLGFPRSLWDQYKADGDGDGTMDPANPHDAIFSLANYFYNQAEAGEEGALNDLFLESGEIDRVHAQENDYSSMLFIHDHWLWPVIGYTNISSPYGPRVDPITGEQGVFHDGVDIPAPRGTPVVAIQDGEVVEVTSSSSGYGHFIRLKHDGGIQSFYGHLSKMGVKRGQRVLRGEMIGLVGNTGKSTGPHLHLGMVQNGQSIDPLTFWIKPSE